MKNAKRMIFLIAVAIAVTAPLASAGVTLEDWDGSLEPNSGLNTPQWSMVVTGGSYTQTTVDEGTIDVTGIGRMYRLGNPAHPGWNHTTTNASLIEFRMKVDTATTNYGAGFIFLTDTTVGGTYRWRELWFSTNSIKARYGASFSIDTTVYHDYRIVIEPGDNLAHLYVDGQTISSMDWSGANGGGDREWLDLGSNNALVKGSSTWDYVRWGNDFVPDAVPFSIFQNSGTEIRWTSIVGKTNVVQYTTDNVNWSGLQPFVVGDGTTKSVFDSVSGRSYRVLELP